jgi:hypothetical protein
MVITDTRVMVFLPMFQTVLPDGSLLAARFAEHLDLILQGTGGKAVARASVVAARHNASRDTAGVRS